MSDVEETRLGADSNFLCEVESDPGRLMHWRSHDPCREKQGVDDGKRFDRQRFSVNSVQANQEEEGLETWTTEI